MRVLKKLFLGDVVAKGTTRQLRKLTTEKPQEDSIIGTWRFNDTVNLPNEVIDYNIDFTYVNSSVGCKRIRLGIYTIYCYTYGNSEITVYSSFHSPPFQADTYKTIAITGGADINNPEFVAWLRANATKIA